MLACPTCGFRYEGQAAVELGKVGVREAEGGDEHTLTLHALANAYGRVGEHQQELDLLQQTLETHEREFGSDHPMLVKVLNDSGMAHLHLGNFVRGREVLERAYKIVENHPDRRLLGSTLLNLSCAYGYRCLLYTSPSPRDS